MSAFKPRPPALKAAALAGLFSLAAASASAQSYATVNIGASFPPDQDLEGAFDDNGTLTAFDGEVEFDPGFFGSLVWGRKFREGSGPAIEIEGFYHALNPDNFTFGGLDLDPNVNDPEEFFGGKASMFGGLVNGVWHVRTETPWSARIGAGVGYARVAYDIDSAFDDGDGALVYQGFLGLGYALSDKVDLHVAGRYFGSTDTEFHDGDFDAESQIDSVVGTIGLTWWM